MGSLAHPEISRRILGAQRYRNGLPGSNVGATSRVPPRSSLRDVVGPAHAEKKASNSGPIEPLSWKFAPPCLDTEAALAIRQDGPNRPRGSCHRTGHSARAGFRERCKAWRFSARGASSTVPFWRIDDQSAAIDVASRTPRPAVLRCDLTCTETWSMAATPVGLRPRDERRAGHRAVH